MNTTLARAGASAARAEGAAASKSIQQKVSRRIMLDPPTWAAGRRSSDSSPRHGRTSTARRGAPQDRSAVWAGRDCGAVVGDWLAGGVWTFTTVWALNGSWVSSSWKVTRAV